MVSERYLPTYLSTYDLESTKSRAAVLPPTPRYPSMASPSRWPSELLTFVRSSVSSSSHTLLDLDLCITESTQEHSRKTHHQYSTSTPQNGQSRSAALPSALPMHTTLSASAGLQEPSLKSTFVAKLERFVSQI